MIVADAKPVDEVWRMVSRFERVVLLGCAGCAAVCRVGGPAQVAALAAELAERARSEGRPMELVQRTVRRQCEASFLEPILPDLECADAVLSMACGVGVSFIADLHPAVRVFPGVDTTFMGSKEPRGVWAERCAGCGRCIVHLTGGICPVACCAKTILNGPCGGSENGLCELSTEQQPVECVWIRIIERCRERGTLERLMEIASPKDWSPSRHGGPRRRDCEEADSDDQDGGAAR
jgi:ferredoxin